MPLLYKVEDTALQFPKSPAATLLAAAYQVGAGAKVFLSDTPQKGTSLGLFNGINVQFQAGGWTRLLANPAPGRRGGPRFLGVLFHWNRSNCNFAWGKWIVFNNSKSHFNPNHIVLSRTSNSAYCLLGMDPQTTHSLSPHCHSPSSLSSSSFSTVLRSKSLFLTHNAVIILHITAKSVLGWQ